jgi:outer membrane protein assembly factor BamA
MIQDSQFRIHNSQLKQHCELCIMHRALLILIFLFLSSSCFAETSPSPTDSANKFIIKKIVLIGNKRTKDRILYRELIFQQGDTLDAEALEIAFRRSTENLNNTLLFNTVNIQKVQDGPDGMDVFIFVAERWYIFPAPIFELADRNFNEWWKTKDFSRTIYGGYLYWNNFRGRNETLVLGVRAGYTQEITVSYSIPYINHRQKDGLAFSYYYSRNHEVSYQTINNHLAYLKEPYSYVKREWQTGIQYSLRQAIYNTWYISINERFTAVSDMVSALNPDFFLKGNTTQQYASLRLLFRHDQRDNVNYPLKGNYFDFEVMKMGFTVFNDDVDFIYLTSQYKRYWELWKHIYFATGVKGKFSSQDQQPYYNTRGLGYGSDYLRGYEYYVIDGQKYVWLKTNLKYELLPVHYLNASIIPTEKFSNIPYSFYLNLYADYGYVQDKFYSLYNPLTNSNLYSFGGGIDFATYYNFVLRAEYSINKFGEKGIFIHFSAPI